uniref:Uncharacterized protein n=1 Tax=Oryza rufipogon TaxID=4529 RepID=A0A0E0QI23_ORYRU
MAAAVVVLAGDGGAVRQTTRRRQRQHMKAEKELGGGKGDRERAWHGRRLRVAALHCSGGLRRARRLRGVEAGSGRVAHWWRASCS